MEDVKTNASEQNTAEVTAGQESQPAEQTPEVTPQEGETGQPAQTASMEAQERMVPLSVVQKERKQRQELQRRLAELEGNRKLSQFDPADLEQVMGHPFVQDLLIKQAKQELTDYARTVLEEYPNLHPVLKKAILKNVRGFVQEATTDVESAKSDLQDYIESIAQEADASSGTSTPKNFQVAATNQSKIVPGTRPAEVQKILAKPLDEWTEQEAKVVEDYTETK